jgi:hypothetical protein
MGRPLKNDTPKEARKRWHAGGFGAGGAGFKRYLAYMKLFSEGDK